MAVAVKMKSEQKTTRSWNSLAVPSLVGTLFLFSSLAIVFKLIPTLWIQFVGNAGGPFGSAVLMGVAMVAAAIGLIYVGSKIIDNGTVHGLRAGIFVAFVGLLLILLLTRWASIWIEYWIYHQNLLGQGGSSKGMLIVTATGVALLVGFFRWFFTSHCEGFLRAFEDQGWFSTATYKKNQGAKVRRGTIFGLMLILGSGIYTLVNHDTLGKDASDWRLNIPFTGKQYIPGNGVVEYNDGTEKLEIKIPGNAGDIAPLLKDVPSKNIVSSISKTMDRKADQVIAQVPVNIDGFDLGFETTLPVDIQGKLPRTITGTVKRDFFVMDRYQLKDLNEQIDPSKYTKISNPAKIPGTIQNSAKEDVDLSQMDGKLVLKTVFAEARNQAMNDGKPFPNGLTPQPATGPTQFAGITLLPQVKYTVPLLLLGLSSWFAWRLVNLPVFADFLIATEAELNKVSWTTRKRLFQDTIVVLTTVFLMSGYLFFMDQIWAHLLSSWPINVIVINQDKAKAQNAEGKW